MKLRIFMIGLVLLLGGCAYYNPSLISMKPVAEQLTVQKIPLEVGLLVPSETRNYVFNSPQYPNFSGRPIIYPIEPYRLAVGEGYEKAALQVFSQFFEKVTLIRNGEETGRQRLVLELRLDDFYLNLFYTNTGMRYIYEELVDGTCRLKVTGTLKSYGKTIWEKKIETPLESRHWVNNFQLRDDVAGMASETVFLALKTLADQIAQESRPVPATGKGWREEVGPAKP
jgi:hypothetical protein